MTHGLMAPSRPQFLSREGISPTNGKVAFEPVDFHPFEKKGNSSFHKPPEFFEGFSSPLVFLGGGCRTVGLAFTLKSMCFEAVLNGAPRLDPPKKMIKKNGCLLSTALF